MRQPYATIAIDRGCSCIIHLNALPPVWSGSPQSATTGWRRGGRRQGDPWTSSRGPRRERGSGADDECRGVIEAAIDRAEWLVVEKKADDPANTGGRGNRSIPDHCRSIGSPAARRLPRFKP